MIARLRRRLRPDLEKTIPRRPNLAFPQTTDSQPLPVGIYLLGSSVQDRNRLAHQSALAALYFAEHYKDFVTFTPNRILDAGCGVGQSTLMLARFYQAAELVGVDRDKKAIETARNLTRSSTHTNRRIDYAVGDVQNNLPAGPFDMVYSSLVVQHLQHPMGMILKAFDVLRPGGVLWLREMQGTWNEALNHPDALWFTDQIFRFQMTIGAQPFISPQLPHLMTGAGFTNIQTHPEDHPMSARAGVQQLALDTLLGLFKNASIPLSEVNRVAEYEFKTRLNRLLADQETLNGELPLVNVIGFKPENS